MPAREDNFRVEVWSDDGKTLVETLSRSPDFNVSLVAWHEAIRDPAELQSIYQRELETGSIKANLRVSESLYRQALGDGRQAVTASIFWLKTRARWKETHAGDQQAGRFEPVISIKVI